MNYRNKFIALAAVFGVSLSIGSGQHPIKPQSKGTAQVAGGYGLFGQTYTLSNGPLLNFTLKSAEYSIRPFDMKVGSTYPTNVGQKFLILHYKIKNPMPKDQLYWTIGGTLFQVVDANNNVSPDAGVSRRESEKTTVGVMLKPGEGIEDLVTYAMVPSNGPVAKLILNLAVPGTKEKVIRYLLGTKPNLVKPLAAPYVDPTDKTGATALAKISGMVGTTYNAGFLDISVDSLALAPGPFGAYQAPTGKKYLIATVTLTNNMWSRVYLDDSSVKISLKTDDDKVTTYDCLKAKHDEAWKGMMMEAGDTTTQRLLIPVANDAQLKTLAVTYNMGNEGMSREFDYDMSAVK